MSNPVGGPQGPNQLPSLSPNQGGNPTDNRVDLVANQVFSANQGASPLLDSLSSRVSVGEVRLSKEDILKQWLESQPAKTQAQQILDILQQKDLDYPFELELIDLENITSLPNVLQNCTRLCCSWCDSLQTLPEIAKSLTAAIAKASMRYPRFRHVFSLTASHAPTSKRYSSLRTADSFTATIASTSKPYPRFRHVLSLTASDAAASEPYPSFQIAQNLSAYVAIASEPLPELSNCTYLDCSYCGCLEAVLLRRDGFYVASYNSPKVVLFEFVDSAKCEIEGVRYLPKALPEELKVLLTPP